MNEPVIFQPDIQVAVEIWDSMNPELKAKALNIHGSKNMVIAKLANALIKHLDIALNEKRPTNPRTS